MDDILVNEEFVFSDSAESDAPVFAPEGAEMVKDSAVSGSNILDSGASADNLTDSTTVGDMLAYVDLDFFTDTLDNLCVPAFSLGFASATLLVLITYGVFKAFGLVRIKN